MMTTLSYALDRSIVIRAEPATVFAFFMDSARWAAWWGAGSTIEPRPGGRVFIRYPNGIEGGGEVLEISPPNRFVFTFGFASGQPIPSGGSRVTITLAPDEEGTRLDLRHELPDQKVRDEHVQGWRYQLSVFANVVADEVNARAADAVDAWFKAWSIADAGEREQTLAAVADPGVRFRDRYSTVDGVRELVPHIGAAQRFLPNVKLERKGAVRHCQGVVLADWIIASPDGPPRGTGTNVFVFDAAARIVSVTGFWS